MSDEVSQLLLERGQTGFAVEGFRKAKESKDYVRSNKREMLIRLAEVQRPRSKTNFVSGETLITNRQVQFRMQSVKLSFDVAKVLLPLSQSSANKDDVVVLLQLNDSGSLSGRGKVMTNHRRQSDTEHQRSSQQPFHHHNNLLVCIKLRIAAAEFSWIRWRK